MLPLRIGGDFMRRKVRREGKRERIGCQQSPINSSNRNNRVNRGDKCMRRGKIIKKAPHSWDGHLSLCIIEIFACLYISIPRYHNWLIAIHHLASFGILQFLHCTLIEILPNWWPINLV